MNPKTVLVALASAVFAAGLTYWAVSPGPSRNRTVAAAKVPPTPVGPPLVISTAGPESPAAQPVPAATSAAPQPVKSKPSPTGEPIDPPKSEDPEASAPPVETHVAAVPQPQPH